jgi:hypothetical protein
MENSYKETTNSTFELSQYISEGFAIFKKEVGLFMGVTIIALLLMLLVSFIPVVGQLIGLFSGMLFAGYYILSDKISQNIPTSFSNFFDGFQKLTPFIIYALISMLFTIIILLVFGGSLFLAVFMRGENPDISSILTGSSLILIFIMGLLFFVFHILMAYVPFYILFKNLETIPAMKSSFNLSKQHFFMIFLFMFVWGLIIMVSCIPLGLGLLATVPAYFASFYASWVDLTGYNKNNEFDVNDHLN